VRRAGLCLHDDIGAASSHPMTQDQGSAHCGAVHMVVALLQVQCGCKFPTTHRGTCTVSLLGTEKNDSLTCQRAQLIELAAQTRVRVGVDLQLAELYIHVAAARHARNR